MKDRPIFFDFEGIGGSGKTTQIKEAANYLRSVGRNVIDTREPGGVQAAEEIRSLIFRLKGEGLILGEGEMALFMAARYFWMKELVIPKLNAGYDILTDRCYPSTLAYQGYGGGLNLRVINGVARVVMQGHDLDAVLLLDTDIGTCRGRRAGNNQGDPFDSQPIEYWEKVINGYREMAKSGAGGLEWHTVDGCQSKDEVTRAVVGVIKQVWEI